MKAQPGKEQRPNQEEWMLCFKGVNMDDAFFRTQDNAFDLLHQTSTNTTANDYHLLVN